jgi:hypothetical protein
VKVEPKKNVLSPPANMVPVYIGAVVAVVGAGVAVGVGVIAKASAQNSADSVATQIRTNGGTQGVCSRTDAATVKKFGNACAALADDNSKVDTDATVGNVGLAVGIAGAAFALGWYLFAPKKEEARQAALWKTYTVSPILGLRENGLALSGAF